MFPPSSPIRPIKKPVLYLKKLPVAVSIAQRRTITPLQPYPHLLYVPAMPSRPPSSLAGEFQTISFVPCQDACVRLNGLFRANGFSPAHPFQCVTIQSRQKASHPLAFPLLIRQTRTIENLLGLSLKTALFCISSCPSDPLKQGTLGESRGCLRFGYGYLITPCRGRRCRRRSW